MITTLPVIHCELGEWGLDHKVPSIHTKMSQTHTYWLQYLNNNYSSGSFSSQAPFISTLHLIFCSNGPYCGIFSAHGSALILTIFLTKSKQNETFSSVRLFFYLFMTPTESIQPYHPITWVEFLYHL